MKEISKRKIILAILSIIGLVVAAAAILWRLEALDAAIQHLQHANISILLLLIPNIMLMYYAAGQIWCPYLQDYNLSAQKMACIEYEQSFVNTVVPSAALSGLIYTTARLHGYGVKVALAGKLYIHRYLVTVGTNWLGILAAIIILLVTGQVRYLPANFLISMLVLVGLMAVLLAVLLLWIYGKIQLPSSAEFQPLQKLIVRFRNVITRSPQLSKYQQDWHEFPLLAKQQKPAALKSWLWGMLYSVLEDTPFLIVAWAMGYPELFLPMVVAAAVGILIGVLIPAPGGIGGFEGAMIVILGSFGTEIALASAIIITARVLVLLGTIASGYFFWQYGMMKIATADSNSK